ncbi:MAG: TonB-dependent receptor [Bacteroidota bacterium]
MRNIYFILLIILSEFSFAQENTISGSIIDDKSYQPVEGASVIVTNSKISTGTDVLGRFTLKGDFNNSSRILVSSIGYAVKMLTVSELKANNKVYILNKQIELSDVKVVANAGDQYKPISKTDIQMRGVSNSQEVLRLVPGLFIGQHQGGGKAEQIFLRGFDCDHGTDIALFADGMPVNMVSHAHGQGYADSHFIIPETIEYTNFKKGPYYADKGDFTTSGFVDFNTRNSLNKDLIRLEGGMFNTFRALGMFNLLNENARKKQQSWYVASEYRYTDAYFDNPQHFKRFNFFTKYNGKISEHNYLSVSASALYSKWNASGQIPDRAVDEGIIGFYGALDPNEGGITSRTNFNAKLITSLRNGDYIKNQVYYSHYTFDLHTNFTFFLVDTVNGDEIRQKESRNMAGSNSSYNHTGYIGQVKLTTEVGVNTRFDATDNSELSHTKNQTTLINPVKLGDITEFSISPYVSETFYFTEHFSVNAGLRFDQFYHKYKNKLAGDPEFAGIGTYTASANTVSPKLNLYYHVNDHLQFYLISGKGFHSNDTRAVVVQKGMEILPAAYGVDFGTVFKPANNIIINAAVWYLNLNQEYVYGGDGGSVEFSGKTRRVGFDFSGRYEPVKSLYFDIDVNYAHGRSINDPKGSNYIPLAPVWSSTAGITYATKKGINGSLRYRYIGDRPANEDYSLTAKGYFITDAVINYSRNNFEFGITINNIFNTKWKETQFDTETRLKNETAPVDEICFTPGTPFAAKLGFTYYFR